MIYSLSKTLDPHQYNIVVPDRVKFNPDTKCIMLWLNPSDKDPFNKGLNPRSEVQPRVNFTLDTVIYLKGSMTLDGDNVTFLQVMGRNNQDQGKPIFVLDSNHGKINLRYRNNYNKDSMVRQPVMPFKSGKFDFEIEFKLAKIGYIKGKINGVGFTYGGRLRWDNTSPAVVSFGVYRTDTLDHTRHIIYTDLDLSYNPITKPVTTQVLSSADDVKE